MCSETTYLFVRKLILTEVFGHQQSLNFVEKSEA